MKGQRALRRGRCSIAGQVVLLTSVTDARRHRFVEFEPARAACQAIHEHPSWRSTRCLAWVLMPDHWHGLIQLDANISLSQLIGRLKGASARTLGLRHPHIRPLWQDSFHDRALRAEEDLPTAAHYILNNPVRAGLVDTADAYPFSGALLL